MRKAAKVGFYRYLKFRFVETPLCCVLTPLKLRFQVAFLST